MVMSFAKRKPNTAFAIAASVLLYAIGSWVITTLYFQSTQTNQQLVMLIERSQREEANAKMLQSKFDEASQLAVKSVQQNIQKNAEAIFKLPGTSEQRLKMHKEAVRFFEEFAKLRNHDEYSRHQLSTAYHFLSTAEGRHDGNKQACALRRKAIEILAELVRDFPENTEYRYDLFYNRMTLSQTAAIEQLTLEESN